MEAWTSARGVEGDRSALTAIPRVVRVTGTGRTAGKGADDGRVFVSDTLDGGRDEVGREGAEMMAVRRGDGGSSEL